jgi:hypothetical protein
MRLFIDGKPVADFPAGRMREVTARAPREPAEAVVIDPETALRRIMRAGRWFYGGVGGLAAVLIGGLVIGVVFGDPSDAIIVLPVAPIAAIACYFLLHWGYGRSLRRWHAGSQARAAALSAPGTPVRADANGLTIGDTAASWASLEVEALYFNQVSVGEDTVYAIERFALLGEGRRFTVDRDLLSAGEPIMQWIYARLIVGRGLKELSGAAE